MELADRAKDVARLNQVLKTRLFMFNIKGVGEHFFCSEVVLVRDNGAKGRENVGMSNLIPDEKSGRRKSKVSVAMAINHGLGDPKAMAKAAADG